MYPASCIYAAFICKATWNSVLHIQPLGTKRFAYNCPFCVCSWPFLVKAKTDPKFAKGRKFAQEACIDHFRKEHAMHHKVFYENPILIDALVMICSLNDKDKFLENNRLFWESHIDNSPYIFNMLHWPCKSLLSSTSGMAVSTLLRNKKSAVIAPLWEQNFVPKEFLENDDLLRKHYHDYHTSGSFVMLSLDHHHFNSSLV